MKRYLIALPLLLSLSACTTPPKPVLMPNKKYEKVGEARADSDINMCMTKADRHLDKGRAERRRRDTKDGAITGALVGGAMGLLTGRSIAVGAAAGATGGAIAGNANNGDNFEIKKRIVNSCLVNKGYQVAGWD